jgi:hypothetical protein
MRTTVNTVLLQSLPTNVAMYSLPELTVILRRTLYRLASLPLQERLLASSDMLKFMHSVEFLWELPRIESMLQELTAPELWVLQRLVQYANAHSSITALEKLATQYNLGEDC